MGLDLVNKIKNTLILFLICACAFFSFQYKKLNTQLDDLAIEKGQLADQYKSLLKVKDSKIQYVYRDKDKIITIIKYLPPEGNFNITTTTDNQQVLTVQNKGFTFKPMIGCGFLEQVKPQVSARLGFWDRWGTGLGIGPSGANVYIDRRFADFIPYIENSTIGLYYNKNGVGLRLATFL